ncbi:MAG: hypothetical protein V4857_11185 [Pseudomonadota bacterium]
MPQRTSVQRDAYAGHRTAAALRRAIDSPTMDEKTRAVRWAAAWALRYGVPVFPHEDAATAHEAQN